MAVLTEKSLSACGFEASNQPQTKPSPDSGYNQKHHNPIHFWPEKDIASLPFTDNDITAGSETELQAVVIGQKEDIDLPQIIERSNYYANIAKRIAAGESPRRMIAEIDRYLNNNRDAVWENSWVRFPARLLSRIARETFEADLLADKQSPHKGKRTDANQFSVEHRGETMVRVPISYLIKLSIAELVGSQPGLPKMIANTGLGLMPRFLSDNTSPETLSLYVVPLRASGGLGKALARETAKRFLLSQLLINFANNKLELAATGQKALIYFSPHPPVRQQQLNDCISDTFYRELFMSPCLSGWDHGEEKHAYMHLCHQVLSRSQLNAVAKLQEAGIIANNLVVLPNLSSTSAANNGIHVSLGSRSLTDAMRNNPGVMTAAREKKNGDLVIKVMEHFLPLFVNTYSASPYRLDFTDFHPEKALGFLPHELDYTHLRMIWRRWKKKANLNVFGQSITPFGPKWLDHLISKIFFLKGDIVGDYRLVNYFVSLMSTERSHALDGTLGNCERLKRDLADMGTFDAKMSTYLLYKLREFAVMGFSGFEGRHYSLFEHLGDDMGQAVSMQVLVTALAFKYIAQGKLEHSHIPDDPSIESERRQIFFGTAIGVPTFFVRKNSSNLFLKKILEKTKKVRQSHRYPAFLRVHNIEYRKALVKTLLSDAADLIEMFGLRSTIGDLQRRLENPDEYSALGKLTRGILSGASKRSVFSLTGEQFNQQAETYYRDTLRKNHQKEALGFLREDFAKLDRSAFQRDGATTEAMRFCLGSMKAVEYLNKVETDLMNDRLPIDELCRFINLMMVSLTADCKDAAESINGNRNDKFAASIH